MKTLPDADKAYERIERGVVEAFVRLAQMISLPRSVGEIYGMLFINPEPLTLDGLVEHLGISKGSASQGLRQLLALGAVRRVYVRGDRRDHFEAEIELRRIAQGFLKGHIDPEIDQAESLIRELEREAATLSGPLKKSTRERLARLGGWHRKGRKLLPLAVQFLKM